MTAPTLSSTEIARRAKSNLALALACLPEERRRDMISFYAFCRVIDDIADDPVNALDEKERELSRWRRGVLEAVPTGVLVLDEVMLLPAKYGFSSELLAEIIDGVTSDLTRTRYETFEELLGYCYKVASVVGLVSVEIFGCRNASSREYAVQLGYALQLTNIIRDVGQDARETGRIYLPQEDLRKFNVGEQELLTGVRSEELVRLLDFQYERACGYYKVAERMLPAEDRERLVASRMMGQIYREILEKLRRKRYPVFKLRCRLHPVRKAWILTKYVMRGWIAQKLRPCLDR